MDAQTFLDFIAARAKKYGITLRRLKSDRDYIELLEIKPVYTQRETQLAIDWYDLTTPEIKKIYRQRLL